MTLAKQSQLDYDGFNLPTDSLYDDDKYEVRPKWYKDPRAEELPTEMPEPTPLPSTGYGAKPMPVEPQEEKADSLSANDSQDLDLGGMQHVMLEIGDEGGEPLSFVLPLVPGGLDQTEIEEPAEIEVEEEEDNITVEEQNPWQWQTCGFLEWLSRMMNGVPQHSGRDSVGLERAISYLEAIDREISKAVRGDLNNEIDISQVEKARDELYNGLTRLQDRLEKVMTNKYPKRKKGTKKKKKADAQSDLVKEATKATHVGGIVVTVPLIISHVARTCINSMVSAGKDIEDCFDKLAKKYDLTTREEAETMQLLADMGYPMRRPRGYDRNEEIDYTSTDNFDWAANYPG